MSLYGLITEPEVCRVCLGGGRMDIVDDELLLGLYEKLTSAKLNAGDGRPNSLCYICSSQLQRCRRFAEMAYRSEKFLNDILMNNQRVTLNTVSMLKIGPIQTLTIATQQNVSYDGYSDSSSNALLEVSVKQESSAEESCKTERHSLTDDYDSPPIKKEKVFVTSKSDLYYNCDECQIKFMSKRQLLAHLRIHNYDTYCKKCNKLFSNTSSLKGHMSIHTGERPFACHICSRTFRKKPYLNSHIRMHQEKPFFCSLDDCNAAFTHPDHLKKHMQIHTRENPFVCNRCNKTFAYKSALTRHVRIHTGIKPFVCTDCDMTFAVQSSLTKHMRIHTGVKPYACEKCDAAFNHAGNLKRHMHTHNEEKLYPCETCDKKFSEEDALREHERVHTGEKPFACNKCDLKFSFNSTLTKHMQTHEEKPVPKEPCPSQPSRPRVRPTCQVCKKQLTSNSHLIIHMRSHTGERPYPCEVCSQTFRTKTILKGHMRVHTGEKVASCEICGMAFTQTGSLGKHMRLHTGELYACHLCGKGYKQSGQLTAHIRNFHEGIKRFSCDICNARFTARGHLRNHMNAHAGIKPYSCLKCSNRFATRTVLRRHIKNSCK